MAMKFMKSSLFIEFFVVIYDKAPNCRHILFKFMESFLFSNNPNWEQGSMIMTMEPKIIWKKLKKKLHLQKVWQPQLQRHQHVHNVLGLSLLVSEARSNASPPRSLMNHVTNLWLMSKSSTLSGSLLSLKWMGFEKEEVCQSYIKSQSPDLAAETLRNTTGQDNKDQMLQAELRHGSQYSDEKA